MVSFIELIKNPRYNFWSRPFVKCAPEIERVFESVSRSCNGPSIHSMSTPGSSSSTINNNNDASKRSITATTTATGGGGVSMPAKGSSSTINLQDDGEGYF